jgi:hypothetical protein
MEEEDIFVCDDNFIKQPGLREVRMQEEAPLAPSLDLYKKIAINFYKELDDSRRMYAGACDVCGQVKFESEMSPNEVPRNTLNLSVVDNVVLDPERVNILICNSCKLHLEQFKIPKFSLYNMGQIGYNTPSSLSVLTLSERVLLSAARSFIIFKRLTHGSFASTGNSITLRQDIQKSFNTLPPALEILCDSVVVVLVDSNKVPSFNKNLDKDTLKKHCPELVIRRSIWLEAFNFLKLNSPLYKDITLNLINFKALPDNDIPEIVFQNVKSNKDPSSIRQDLGHEQVNEELEAAAIDDANLVRPIHTTSTIHADPIMSPAAILESARKPKFVISTALGDPLSEFTDGNFFHKAFPHLFYNGQGEFVSTRKVKVSLREWFEHKLRFVDTRFSSDPHFISVVHNMVSRHENISKARVMIDQSRIHSSLLDSIADVLPADFTAVSPLTDVVLGSSDFGSCDKSQRGTDIQRKMVADAMKVVYTLTQHQPGSRAAKHCSRRQIMTMIRENEGVDLFHTLSSAELHWPEVQRLISQRKYIELCHRRPNDYQELPQLNYKRRVANSNKYPLEVVFHFK